MKKKATILTIILIILICLTLWIIWGNKALERSVYTVRSERLPAAFHGFRIVHISDLHNAEFGECNSKLLEMIRISDPDLIAITGDLIDSRHTNIRAALEFAGEAVKIAPCYYVSGNHESRIDEYNQLKESLEALGVAVLSDARTDVKQGGEVITLMGVDDPAFSGVYEVEETAALINDKLLSLKTEDRGYTILLSHRPEHFDVYVQKELDLVLTGHAHGGQFRLPLVGGLFAPSQGILPEYDAGLFARDQTTMAISRGLGNSAFPFRLNNRPEVVVIELEHLPAA